MVIFKNLREAKNLTSSDNSTNDINTLSFSTKNWNKRYEKVI